MKRVFILIAFISICSALYPAPQINNTPIAVDPQYICGNLTWDEERGVFKTEPCPPELLDDLRGPTEEEHKAFLKNGSPELVIPFLDLRIPLPFGLDRVLKIVIELFGGQG